MDKDRLAMMKAYLKQQEEVKVSIPPTISETSKGKVIRYFEGSRAGYYFLNGFCFVKREDLYKFKQTPYIIHDGNFQEGSAE